MKKVWLLLRWFFNVLVSLVIYESAFSKEAPRKIRPTKFGALLLFVGFIVTMYTMITIFN